MIRFALMSFLFLAASLVSHAQPVLLQKDNNSPKAAYNFSKYGIEESVILLPAGPCLVEEIRIYYGGKAGLDTLVLAGDAAEGGIPPTSWVWHFNALIPPIIVDYDGTPGWRTIDLRSHRLHLSGYQRLVIQHRIREGAKGPSFVFDTDGQSAPNSSFYMNPYESSFPPEYNIPGKYYLVNGDYLVRLLVTYDYPQGAGSAPPPTPSFTDVTIAAGLVSNLLPIKATQAAAADWNNDGFDDVAFGGRFFRNNQDGTFSDVTSTIGINGAATVWGDFDNDGWVDCFSKQGFGNDKLFRNRGDGSFADVTATSGIVNNAPTMTPLWLDYDSDGQLDLFIANARREEAGQEVYYQDVLWKNLGNGRFQNVTLASNITRAEPSPFRDCYGASACDYNRDNRPDIFVANYRLAPDFLHRNNGDGTFTEVGATTRVRGVPTQDSRYFGHGMGCEWGDYNNDGWFDLAVGNLGHPDSRGLVSNPSLLYRNLGPSQSFSFEEIHASAGIQFKEMNAGVCWADLNNDGWLDLWHGQISYSAEGTNGEPKRFASIYMNRGSPDFRFDNRTWELIPPLHGAWTAARLDYDNDGDLDLLLCSSHEGVRLYRNDIPSMGKWIELRLTGNPNAGVPQDAIGTMVSIYGDGNRSFHRYLSGNAGSLATQHSAVLHFGVGEVSVIDSVVVRYPNGLQFSPSEITPGRRYTIPYLRSPVVSAPAVRPVLPSWTLEQATILENSLLFTVGSPSVLRDVHVSLVTTLGRSMMETQVAELSEGRHALRLPFLPAGLYFLSIRTASEIRTVPVPCLGTR